MLRSVAPLALVLVACAQRAPAASEDASASDAVVDVASATVDVAVDSPRADADADADADSGACATPQACAWIEDYERDIVGRLSGQRPISGDLLLRRRSSAAQRETARTYLRDELAARGLDASFHDYATGRNVRARLAPTTGAAASTLVVGAHYDGVAAGPAAADDATGVALVLVAARYLSAMPRRDHPIEFVLFDQEESGLIGSAAYAAALSAEGATVHSAHCFDMLSFDGDGDNAVELWSPSPGLEALYRLHGAPRGIPVASARFSSSDHQSFLSRGFPATGVGEEFAGGDHTPHYHRVTDTYEMVDFGYLLRMTHLALDVLADLALD